jgi:hypothetical protein
MDGETLVAAVSGDIVFSELMSLSSGDFIVMDAGVEQVNARSN